MNVHTVTMTLVGIGYGISAVSYFYHGKPWMGLTLFLYALTVGTLYMAGKA